jgi:hypothetical protein
MLEEKQKGKTQQQPPSIESSDDKTEQNGSLTQRTSPNKSNTAGKDGDSSSTNGNSPTNKSPKNKSSKTKTKVKKDQ